MTARERRRLAPEDRCREILDAAVKLFGATGYAEVTGSDIARAAGVTPALVHHYFGSKRDIYLAVLASFAEAAPNIIGARRPGAVRTRVAGDVDAWMEFVDGRRELWLATDGLGDVIPDQAVADVILTARERSIERMLEGYPDAVVDCLTARAALRGWLGFHQATLRQWIRGEIERSLARVLLIESLLATFRQVIPAAG
jgi:AcrR family transcriptional regulator